jgi:uncharacterized protein
MIEASTYGVPNWVDLSVPNVQAAARFYRDLLGWTVDKHHSSLGDYYIGTAGGREVGGMMAAPLKDAGEPAVWTVLFAVADVDTTVKAVEAAGGGVLEPPFDLPAARMAIVADPLGATFGVIAHQKPVGAWMSSTPGAACWVELLTRDPAAAVDFYRSVFAWQASTETYGDVPYTTLALDGELVAGAMPMPDEVPDEVSGMWSVYFAVDDCAAVERRAEELGGQVLKSTTRLSEGRFAVLADPQGGTFQVMDQQR